jgi:hypothetical protein
VSSPDDSLMLEQSVAQIEGLDVEFRTESLPSGTAGCIRDSAGKDDWSLLVVLQASILRVPDIQSITQTHRDQACELTVAFEPSSDGSELGNAAGI